MPDPTAMGMQSKAAQSLSTSRHSVNVRLARAARVSYYPRPIMPNPVAPGVATAIGRMNPPRSCTQLLGWLAIACAIVASGCASGSWFESPSEAALPLDPPKHAYPTAVRTSLTDNEPQEPQQHPPAARQTAPIAEQAPPVPQQQ